MRKEYDFSKAKRAREIEHLRKLQEEMAGKSRITIRIDNKTLAVFKAKAEATGANYQTLINEALNDFIQGQTIADVIRETIREELAATT